MNYDGKTFRPVSSSDNAEVDSSVLFKYQQKGNVLSCTYKGANILVGNLLGKVTDTGQIEMSYHQINTKSELMTGRCQSTPEIMANGNIRLHEKWNWTSGDFSKGESILEEI